MLQSLRQILGCHVHATDGDLGHVHDLYFDDQSWAVRYIVVDTSQWLTGRRVLLAPQKAAPLEPMARHLLMMLTKDQIRTSPDVGSDLPVARQKEAALAQHYGWIPYWDVPDVPFVIPPFPIGHDTLQQDQNQGDPHLRSLHEVLRYEVVAVDGPAGSVADLLGDTSSWNVQNIVVTIGSSLRRKHVLMPPQAVESIVWSGSFLRTTLHIKEVEQFAACNLPPSTT